MKWACLGACLLLLAGASAQVECVREACLETKNNAIESDDDCCGVQGDTSCMDGYSHFLVVFEDTDLPSGFHQCNIYDGNTCCVLDDGTDTPVGYPACSDCQNGCGGSDSEECWNSEHTAGEFGVCDCDGQCDHFDNYQGDMTQLCTRSASVDYPACYECQDGCGGSDSEECWNSDHTYGDFGVCDCDGQCDHFDNYEGDGKQLCTRLLVCECPEEYTTCDGFCDRDDDCGGDDWCEFHGDENADCVLDCGGKPETTSGDNPLCSDCQNGCGGSDSDECWDAAHTSGEFGVCDCDGQCNDFDNYQGDMMQLCTRFVDTPVGYPACSDCQNGCGGSDSEECWDAAHTAGEFGVCDCDGQCNDFDNYQGDMTQLCTRSESDSGECQAWGYGSEDCNNMDCNECHNSEECDWGNYFDVLDTNPGGYGYSGPWTSEEWVDTPHDLDAIRMSPGCSVEVSDQAGSTYTYHSDTRLCGNEVGCDSVRRVRVFKTGTMKAMQSMCGSSSLYNAAGEYFDDEECNPCPCDGVLEHCQTTDCDQYTGGEEGSWAAFLLTGIAGTCCGSASEYPACSECQDGCGGSDDDECWNAEHTLREFGVCDCDGQCDHLDNYQGDLKQLCNRSVECDCPAGYTRCNGFCDLDSDCVGDDWCEAYDGEHANCVLDCGENFDSTEPYPICTSDDSKCRTYGDDCYGACDEPQVCADEYQPVVDPTSCELRCFPPGCDIAMNTPVQQCRDCSEHKTRDLLFARLRCC